ncbi:MAG TPA: hypothetical protein VN032_08095 [Thermoanaerobaculia bacterium]|nr:hypothetical protein [Thermoanaerobaculia bacterium]
MGIVLLAAVLFFSVFVLRQDRLLYVPTRRLGARELFVIPGAHHNDTYAVGGEAYWGAWERFLAQVPEP